MPSHDDRIDAYIARSAPFAQPILEHLRGVVHEACPTAEETMKWSMPHFTYEGRILAGMSAFKQHAAFGMPILDRDQGPAQKREEAMGSFGRITALSDLPARRALVAQLRQAMKAIDGGAKLRSTRRDTPRPALPMPDDFAHALAKNAAARAHFSGFAPGKQRDYLEWIIEARQEGTRTRRIAQAVEWLSEGKARHWKYEKC